MMISQEGIVVFISSLRSSHFVFTEVQHSNSCNSIAIRLISPSEMFIHKCIQRQRELGKPLGPDTFASTFANYCKDPGEVELKGLSIICHSLSVTSEINPSHNITVEPDEARAFFGRFLAMNSEAWENMDPNDGDNLVHYNNLLTEALNRGTKDVKKVLEN